jgi:GAF domain-containing protein
MGHNGEDGLADLVVWDSLSPSDWPTREATLTEICLCLTEALPSAESAGMVMFTPDLPAPGQRLELDRADVIGAAPAGAAAFQIERKLGEGPVLTACRSQHIVTSGDVTGDERWRQFGSAVVTLQLHSATTVPLAGLSGATAGALCVYSNQRDAFDTPAVHLIAAVADVARNALLAAAMVESTRRAYQALSEASDRSRMVNQAVGVLIHRNCTEEQARWRLSRMASRNGEDVTSAARMIVEEARAEARLSSTGSRHPSRSL